METFRRLLVSLLLIFTLGSPLVSRADTLDNLLDVLISAGVVDPALRDARDLISCLSSQPDDQCSGAAMESPTFKPEDPAIQSVVELVRAAYQQKWLKVLEVAGTDVLFQVVCETGLSIAGPFKNLCTTRMKSLFPKVVALGKPVVRQVLVAIGSNQLDEWLKLLAMTGPQLGCELIPPSVPGKDTVCGPLAEVLAFAADKIKDAANAVWGGINNFGDWVSGQKKHMDRDHYYALYWQSWYHYGTWLGVVKNWQGLGNLLAYIRDPCEHYFDSHTMSQDNAQELCDGQRDRFSREVHAFKKALDPAPDAFYESVISGMPAVFAIEDYGKQTNSSKRALVKNLCTSRMKSLFPFPEPDPGRCQAIKSSLDGMGDGPFHDMMEQLYQSCLNDQATQLPSPTVWSYVCKPLGNRFIAELDQERAKLDDALRDLVIARCLPPAGWSPADGLDFTCPNYPAFDQCLEVFSAIKGNRDRYCHLDQQKADNKLARTIRNELGLKRCGISGETTVVCTRPWKRDRCELLRKEAIKGLSQPSALRCELVFDASYLSGIEKAKEIITALNDITRKGGATGQNDEVPEKKPGVQGLQLAPRSTMRLKPGAAAAGRLHLKSADNCASTWDPLAIHCQDASVLFELSSHTPPLQVPPLCQGDPNHDGSSVPCYSGVLTIPKPPKDKVLVDPTKLGRIGEGDIGVVPGPAKTGTTGGSRGGFAPGGQAAMTAGKARAVAQRADLASHETLTLGGAQVRWGATHTLTGHLPSCAVQAVYYVANIGAADSAAFAISWRDPEQNKPIKVHRIYGLKKGVEYLKTDQLPIHRGSNRFQLLLDSASEVSEVSESNNSLALTIQFNGSCGSVKPGSRWQKTAPGRGDGQKSLPAPAMHFSPGSGDGQKSLPAPTMRYSPSPGGAKTLRPEP